MWYRVKINRDVKQDNGNIKNITEYYLTDALNFGYAGIRVLEKLGKKIEVEDVQLMKQYKPAINDYKEGDKIYIIKVAEDYEDDNGNIKTMKYPMPVFAKNDSELYTTVKEFLRQGLSTMRLTTISETKWIYI